MHILTPQEQISRKNGTCYDTSLFTDIFFSKNNVEHECWLFSTRREYDASKGIWNDPTHMFVIYHDIDANVWQWLEGSLGAFKANTVAFTDKIAILDYIFRLCEKANGKGFLRHVPKMPQAGISIHDFYRECMAFAVDRRFGEKEILFPQEEIQNIEYKNIIWTTRVDEDFDVFNVGDIVISPWETRYKIVQEIVIEDIFQHPFYVELTQSQIDFLDKYDRMKVLKLSALYDKPYTLGQIKASYSDSIFQKLKNDPVHSWRAQTGIELIHKEPTINELRRIYQNWTLMPKHLKDISDQKSIEIFGMPNEQHFVQLMRQRNS